MSVRPFATHVGALIVSSRNIHAFMHRIKEHIIRKQQFVLYYSLRCLPCVVVILPDFWL